MCSGEVSVMVLPLTDAISTICPTGRSIRENQPRDGLPGGDRAADHCTYSGSDSSSMTASVPRVKPWAFATVIEVAPFAPSAARSTEERTWGQSGPIHTTAPLKPLLLSSVFLGPAPRKTIPLLIKSVRVIANVPAESETTFPSGQAVSAAWMAAVASCAPSPNAAPSTVAQTVVRAGIPSGIPGFQVVSRSGGNE